MLAVVTAAPSIGVAEEAPPPGRDRPPLWTTAPVRIDRSQETRQRIEATDATARRSEIVVAGDGRLRDGMVIEAGGRRLHLFAVEPIDRGRICVGGDGRRWACGLKARATFSALVVDRNLVCRSVAAADGADPVVDCVSRGLSLSRTLLADGWAELDAAGATDPELVGLYERAKREGRGVWATNAPD